MERLRTIYTIESIHIHQASGSTSKNHPRSIVAGYVRKVCATLSATDGKDDFQFGVSLFQLGEGFDAALGTVNFNFKVCNLLTELGTQSATTSLH